MAKANANAEAEKTNPFLEKIKEKAAALNKRIVLCEGEDSRVVKAASDAVKQKIARIVLLGNPEEIKKANPDIDLSGVDIVDPATSEKRSEYAQHLFRCSDAEGGRCRRLGVRGLPFYGKHFAPGASDREGCTRRSFGFQLLSYDCARVRKSVLRRWRLHLLGLRTE